MCYFNFLTGKAYKANSDIANVLSDYCKKNAITFTGFATVQQAKRLFTLSKKAQKVLDVRFRSQAVKCTTLFYFL